MLQRRLRAACLTAMLNSLLCQLCVGHRQRPCGICFRLMCQLQYVPDVHTHSDSCES
jgi:hypothetical protein